MSRHRRPDRPPSDGWFAGAVLLAANLLGLGVVVHVAEAKATSPVSTQDAPSTHDLASDAVPGAINPP